MHLTDDILEQYLQNILPLRIHVKKPAWQFLTMIYLITIRFPNGEESRQDVLSHMNFIHSSMDDIHSLLNLFFLICCLTIHAFIAIRSFQMVLGKKKYNINDSR